MAVVQVKTFQVSSRDAVLAQSDLDALATTVNAFLSTLTSTNVLDVVNAYTPIAKYGSGSAFTTTIIYLG